MRVAYFACRSYEELLRQGLQLAQGLRYMHHDAMPGKLVMHRDLKPDNVGFDSNGNLKLIDLGLGRVRKSSSWISVVLKKIMVLCDGKFPGLIVRTAIVITILWRLPSAHSLAISFPLVQGMERRHSCVF